MKMLQIHHREIPLEIKRARKSRNMVLRVEPSAPKLVLTVPLFTLNFQINSFLRQQEGWIHKNWSKLEDMLAKRPVLDRSLAYYKNKARVLIRERLTHFNQYYQFQFNRVFFKDQKTRWGSCSTQKNLNFNWRLVLAPSEILDYVVVHELCHLKEMNHSSQFWNLVAEQIPDFRQRRKWLKENHYLLMV